MEFGDHSTPELPQDLVLPTGYDPAISSLKDWRLEPICLREHLTTFSRLLTRGTCDTLQHLDDEASPGQLMFYVLPGGTPDQRGAIEDVRLGVEPRDTELIQGRGLDVSSDDAMEPQEGRLPSLVLHCDDDRSRLQR